MSDTAGVRRTSSMSQRRAITAATIGSFVEYYDFVIYGFFATVIADLFFPSESETVSLLLTFGAFALSYAARPLGALIFGFIGDKYGRRAPLTVAIMLIAGCTGLIGLLPTYESLGIAAPVMLTAARLIQGISVGGEYGGSLAFIAEYSPDTRRGFYTAWVTITIGLALAVGAGVASFLTAVLTPDALASWGWRVPFLFGLPLGVVGLYMRLKLEETPHFVALQEHMEIETAPLRVGIRKTWRAVLVGMGIMVTPALVIYLYYIYMPTYLSTELGYADDVAQRINLIGLAFYCAFLPVFAALCDRIGRRPVLIGGVVATAVVTYPAFVVLGGSDAVLATIAMCAMGLAYAPYSATSLVAVAESFPTTFRYTGVSLSLQIPVTVLSGTAPLIATALIASTGNDLSPALMVVAGCVVSLVASLAYRETRGVGLRAHADELAMVEPTAPTVGARGGVSS